MTGRTNSSNVTKLLTGLPGRPNSSTSRPSVAPRAAECERLARLDGDAPEVDAADGLERRPAPRHGRPPTHRRWRPRCPRRRCPASRRPTMSPRSSRRDAQGVRRSRARLPGLCGQRRGAAVRDLGSHRAAAPAGTSSSPVDRIATRGRRCTAALRVARRNKRAHPMSGHDGCLRAGPGRRRVTSLPAGRHRGAGRDRDMDGDARRQAATPGCASVSSTRTTASAPGGHHRAGEDAHRRAGLHGVTRAAWPAATSPMTRRRIGASWVAPATSALRTA